MRVFDAADFVKCAAMLLALTARAALAGAACDAHNSAELRSVFTVAVGLDDALRLTTSGSDTPEYQQLRATRADYDRRRTLPCSAAAVELLRSAPDAMLGRSLLELAASRAHSEARIPPQSLVRFFAARPADFQDALARMPMTERCALVETIESGWPIANSTAAENAGKSDRLIADLKRVHCHAPAPRPKVEAPSNRARNPMEPQRRQPRPRFA